MALTESLPSPRTSGQQVKDARTRRQHAFTAQLPHTEGSVRSVFRQSLPRNAVTKLKLTPTLLA